MASAAVISLQQTIDRLLYPSSILPDDSEGDFIREEFHYLLSFLEAISSLQSSKRLDALERQMEDLVHKSEDLIKSYVSDQFLSELESSRDESLTFVFSQELLKVKQQISSLTKSLENKEEYSKEDDQQPSNSFTSDAVSSTIDSVGKNKMVGFNHEVRQLKDWLVSGSTRLQIISIVGMTGIGKTTLAKEVYHDPIVSNTFSDRCFVRIGPNYQLKECLLLILAQMGFHIDDEMHEKGYVELGRHLHHFLFSRRYLIVLEDIWDTEVLEDLRMYFPYWPNGSRIILTTMLVDVASYADAAIDGHIFPNGLILQMPFLDDDESWNLLHQMVFTTGESCYPQLEKIGKKIAKNCEGLPLAIVEAGKLLSQIEKTVENWKNVAENLTSLIIRTDDDTPISESVSLCYKQLPQHLKPCFLYMGVFPQNYEIRTSKLFKLWAAEGFFEPQRSESLAMACLDNLVSRSLVLVCQRSSYGRIKSSRIHFIYRNLCVSVAQKEKFFHVINKYAKNFPEGTNSQQRLCMHNNIVLGFEEVQSSMESVSEARSLLCFGPQCRYPLRVYLGFRLLGVLDAVAIRFYNFPDEVLKLVELKYVAITYDGNLPPSIYRLRKLEVLIVRQHQSIKYLCSPVYLPVEIWLLQELRHLECMGTDLPDPSSTTWENGDNSHILENLLTLSGVSIHSCKQGVLERMPNLIKLGIRIESTHVAIETLSFLGDFTCLHHLESFSFAVVHPNPRSQVFSSLPTFPSNLLKLSLSGCGFSWEYMKYIGRLPNLTVLKLGCDAFRGPEWELIDENFPCLHFLLLQDLDIEYWGARESWGARWFQLPNLEHLIIRHCYKFRKISLEIGDISALEKIEVDDCSQSIVIWARQMQEEQQSLNYSCTQIQIHSSQNDKKPQSMTLPWL